MAELKNKRLEELAAGFAGTLWDEDAGESFSVSDRIKRLEEAEHICGGKNAKYREFLKRIDEIYAEVD